VGGEQKMKLLAAQNFWICQIGLVTEATSQPNRDFGAAVMALPRRCAASL
jgi:hypothetical protein